MKKWDYLNVDGSNWNHRPLEEQLDILKEYYPIGYNFRYGVLGGELNEKHPKVKIMGYIQQIGSVPTPTSTLPLTWYLLNIKFDSGRLDSVHPGFFYPCIELIRDKKIDDILNTNLI